MILVLGKNMKKFFVVTALGILLLSNQKAVGSSRLYHDTQDGCISALIDCDKLLQGVILELDYDRVALSQRIKGIVDSIGFDSQVMLLIGLLYKHNQNMHDFIMSHFSQSVVCNVNHILQVLPDEPRTDICLLDDLQ